MHGGEGSGVRLAGILQKLEVRFAGVRFLFRSVPVRFAIFRSGIAAGKGGSSVRMILPGKEGIRFRRRTIPLKIMIFLLREAFRANTPFRILPFAADVETDFRIPDGCEGELQNGMPGCTMLFDRKIRTGQGVAVHSLTECIQNPGRLFPFPVGQAEPQMVLR